MGGRARESDVERVLPYAILLRGRYQMSGVDVDYAAMGSRVLTYGMRLPGASARSFCSVGTR
eukprot:2781058-Rhodomonas_salina.1